MDRLQNPESSLLESSAIIKTMALDGKACFLQAFPRELLLTICEEVFGDEYDRDTGSLARMARTCRFLNRVATPMLYRDIRHPECRLDPTNPNDIGIDNLAVFEKNLHLFLALHNNPALGPTIRAMQLTPPCLHAEFPPYYTSLTLNKLKVYRTAISKLLDIDPRMVDKYGNMLPAMGLVCSAPRLRTLTLAEYSAFGNTEFLLNRHNGRISGPKMTLPNLTKLTIHSPVAEISRSIS
jgi:hypothetical protein